ncbi:MAG: hypothetical protein ACFCUI_05360 [Bernardetiaceae bacterium]
MKRLLVILSVFFSIVWAVPQTAQAQCDTGTLTSIALNKLGDHTFVKSYRIDGRDGKRKTIEYTCVFSKDTDYRIRIASKDGGANGIIATLYDSKRNQVGTSFISNKFLNGITYKCEATGIYYLKFEFHNSKNFCGAAVLGFHR